MKLYDLETSGNCYKIRLFLSVLGIEYTKVPVDVKAGENKASEFLEMNPNGLVPVLTDGETTIYDSAAILVYLAKTYADEVWLPDEAIPLSNVIRWLTFEQNEGRYGLHRARAKLLNMPTPLAQLGTLEDSQTLARQALDALEKSLSQSDWLAGGSNPTICDIACYPYAAMGPEGGVSLQPYSAVRRWMDKIESLDGYIALPGQAGT